MTGPMVDIRLKYLTEDLDRHGNVRLYVRMSGRPKVRIREKFGTDEFMAAYHAALCGNGGAPRAIGKAARGSFRHLCQLYYASTAFTSKDRSTQEWRRHHLDL